MAVRETLAAMKLTRIVTRDTGRDATDLATRAALGTDCEGAARELAAAVAPALQSQSKAAARALSATIGPKWTRALTRTQRTDTDGLGRDGKGDDTERREDERKTRR